jgi:hypothetical protein
LLRSPGLEDLVWQSVEDLEPADRSDDFVGELEPMHPGQLEPPPRSTATSADLPLQPALWRAEKQRCGRRPIPRPLVVEILRCPAYFDRKDVDELCPRTEPDPEPVRLRTEQRRPWGAESLIGVRSPSPERTTSPL